MGSDELSLLKLGAEAAREGYGLFLGNILSNAILVIGSIAVAWLLGSDAYGVYSLSFTIPSIIVLFASLGIDQAVIKYVSEYSSKQLYRQVWQMFWQSMIFRTGLAIAATIPLYFFSDVLAASILNRPYMGGLLKLASLLVIFQSVYSLCSSMFVGLGKASLTGGLAILQAVAKVSLMLTLLVLGFMVWGAVFGHIFGYMVAAVIGSVAVATIIYRKAASSSINDDPEEKSVLRKLIVYGLPLYGSTILAVLVSQYNNIVLANFASNVEIGSYAAALNISTIIFLVSTPIATVLYPSFSKASTVNKVNLSSLFDLAIRYSILLVTPTALFVSAFSRDLVDVIYGESFQPASSYLSLYAIFYSIYPILIVEVSYFNGVGFPEKTFLVNLLIMLLVLPLSPLMATSLKVPGVILSVIIANIVAMIYATVFLTRRGVKLECRRVLKIYASAIISAVLTLIIIRRFVISPLISLILGGIVFITLYLFSIAVSRPLDETDYSNLREVLGGLRLVGGLIVRIIDAIRAIDNGLRRRL